MKTGHWIALILCVFGALVYVVSQDFSLAPAVEQGPPLSEAELQGLLKDPAALERGQKLYRQTCAVCHGEAGEGRRGPNLTDNHWIHGRGTLIDILQMIQKGDPMRGMPGWDHAYPQRDLAAIAVFVMKLQGTNPPDAKAPEGRPRE